MELSPGSSAQYSAGPALKIVEAGQISAPELRALETWIRAGGVALFSGVPESNLRWCDSDERAGLAEILDLAGLRPRRHDPSLARARPALTDPGEILFPLQAGDGLRLGRLGLGHALDLEVVDAKALARVYRDLPEANLVPRRGSHPSITVRSVGEGTVYFTSFSLARVAYCYPNAEEEATDCSAAASAQMLMRLMVANLLWSHAGQAWPVARQAPGHRSSVVAVTGDVHADFAGFQIESAIRLAEIAAPLGIPITFYVVGEVAARFPSQYEHLKSMTNVEIGTHSARGQQYRLGHSRIPFRRRGGVHGPAAVFEDVRLAETLLRLEQWPEQRHWWTSIRTEAWGSNERESGAWSGMRQAGIALVLDHQIDTINSHPAITPPSEWLAGSARNRLSLPAFSRHVHTATDDFRSPEQGLPLMFTLPSPQPDPCCNRAVRFQDYLPYVLEWHAALTDLGELIGTTQVWLWHPSTPVGHGALDELSDALQSMANNPRVRFSRTHELASWNRNRHLGRLKVDLDAQGGIAAMNWSLQANAELAPLPPQAHPDARTVSFWVYGDHEVAGWHTETLIVGDRVITILSQSIIR